MAIPRVSAMTLAASLCAASSIAMAQTQPRFGVCRQEIVNYVEQQLGQTVKRIEVQSFAERMPPRSLFDLGSALVYVEECSGFHGFEIRGTQSDCEDIPHYGTSSGSYIRYEGAFEGCKTL